MKTTNKLTDEDIIKAREILENNKDDYLINRFGEWIEGIEEKIQKAKKEERERIVRILKNLLEEEARYGDTPEYDLLERILKEINLIKK